MTNQELARKFIIERPGQFDIEARIAIEGFGAWLDARASAEPSPKCQHAWEPVENYGLPTGFERCSECDETRAVSAEPEAPREFWCGACNTKMREVSPGQWQHDDIGCLAVNRTGDV